MCSFSDYSHSQTRIQAEGSAEILKETTQSVSVVRIPLFARQDVTIDSIRREELLQAFTINYAAEEDRIRALWSAILEEQLKLHVR